MGLGDVKLSVAMGILLGYPLIILACYIAFLTGAVVALILIMGRRKKFKGDSIPFGPFLVIGMYSALLGGMNLWNLSLHLLFHL
jgi:leader peptidase (prepilin peptidase)/N-methyltransferase